MKIFDEDYDNLDFANKRARAIQKYFDSIGNKRFGRYTFMDRNFKQRLKESVTLDNSIFKRKPLLKKIDGIPLGITQFGEVLVMPRMKECVPISIYGEIGSGKTTLGHVIIDHIYNNQDFNVCILNDYHNECYSWTYPTHSIHFKTLLRSFGYKDGVPLPIVICAPNTDGEQIKVPIKGISKLVVDLPFKEFLERLEDIYPLDASGKYYENVIDYLKDCKSEEEFFSVLDEKLKEFKTHKDSRNKITSILHQAFRSKIVSLDNVCTNRIKIKYRKEEKSNDFFPIQLINCGLVPVISTLKIFKKNYFSAYIKFILDELIARMGSGEGTFGEKSLMVFIDEATLLTSTKNETLILESIKDAVLSGRFFRTSLMISAQNASSVDEIVRNNCRYTFAFKSKGIDAQIIGEDLGLIKKQKGLLRKLKTGEFIAHTDLKSGFHIYDILGNRLRKKENGPIVCKIIPPLSQHLQRVSSKLDQSMWEDGPHLELANYAGQILKKNDISLFNNNGDRLFSSQGEKFYDAENTEPQLIERFDYRELFWGAEGSVVNELDYDEVRKNGWVICKYEYTSMGKKDFYYTLRREENITEFVTPYLKNPPPNVQILYNIYTRTAQLRGLKCPIHPRTYKLRL